MSKSTACTCANPDDFTWHKSPCNEEGWHCLSCGNLAAGEPPGYRPDLDVTHLGTKVESLMMDLHMGDLVYFSNSTDGDCCVGAVVRECRGTGYFDQYSIIAAIMGHANRTHAEYWKAQGDAIRAATDKRDRCPCGKLASCWGGGHPPRCSDCAMDQGLGLFASLAAESRDPSEPEPFPDDPWDAYGIWEAKWMEDHPLDDEDDRDSLALIEVYAKTPIEELRAIWDAERARREDATSSVAATFAAMAAIPDDPPGTDEAVMRAIDAGRPERPLFAEPLRRIEEGRAGGVPKSGVPES